MKNEIQQKREQLLSWNNRKLKRSQHTFLEQFNTFEKCKRPIETNRRGTESFKKMQNWNWKCKKQVKFDNLTNDGITVFGTIF